MQELVGRWGDMIRDTAGGRRKRSCISEVSVERGRVHELLGAGVHGVHSSTKGTCTD